MNFLRALPDDSSMETTVVINSYQTLRDRSLHIQPAMSEEEVHRRLAEDALAKRKNATHRHNNPYNDNEPDPLEDVFEGQASGSEEAEWSDHEGDEDEGGEFQKKTGF